MVYPLIALAIWIFIIAAVWKVFVKAGQPGWGCIIPIYNIYCLCKMAGRPGWWTVLFFVPVANIVVAILVMIDIAKNFGKSGAFAAGLIFLPFIFYPILGFGDAQYVGGGSGGSATPPVAAAV